MNKFYLTLFIALLLSFGVTLGSPWDGWYSWRLISSTDKIIINQSSDELWWIGFEEPITTDHSGARADLNKEIAKFGKEHNIIGMASICVWKDTIGVWIITDDNETLEVVT